MGSLCISVTLQDGGVKDREEAAQGGKYLNSV